MINWHQMRRFCSEDPALIEGYQEAISDPTHMWHIHHRRETDEGITARALIKRKEYFHRPACELILLKPDVHHRLHQLGKHFSEEHRKKISKALSGRHLPVKTRKKLSKANRGKHLSTETRKKLSQIGLGKHWYTDGAKNVFARSCPPGFHPGLIHHRRKSSSAAQERGEELTKTEMSPIHPGPPWMD